MELGAPWSLPRACLATAPHQCCPRKGCFFLKGEPAWGAEPTGLSQERCDWALILKMGEKNARRLYSIFLSRLLFYKNKGGNAGAGRAQRLRAACACGLAGPLRPHTDGSYATPASHLNFSEARGKDSYH